MIDDYIYLKGKNTLIRASMISSIQIYPPKEIKLEFPELITRKKRQKYTDWRCTITMSGCENVFLKGECVVDFLNYISKEKIPFEVDCTSKESLNAEK